MSVYRIVAKNKGVLETCKVIQPVDKGDASFRRYKTMMSKTALFLEYFPKLEKIVSISHEISNYSELLVMSSSNRQVLFWGSKRCCSNMIRVDEKRVIFCTNESGENNPFNNYYNYRYYEERTYQLKCLNVDTFKVECSLPLEGYSFDFIKNSDISPPNSQDLKTLFKLPHQRGEEEHIFKFFLTTTRNYIELFSYDRKNQKISNMSRIDFDVTPRMRMTTSKISNTVLYPNFIKSQKRPEEENIPWKFYPTEENFISCFHVDTTRKGHILKSEVAIETLTMFEAIRRLVPLESYLNSRGEEIVIYCLNEYSDLDFCLLFYNLTNLKCEGLYNTDLTSFVVRVFKKHIFIAGSGPENCFVDIFDKDSLDRIKRSFIFKNRAKDILDMVVRLSRDQQRIEMVSSWKDHTIRIFQFWGLGVYDELFDERISFLKDFLLESDDSDNKGILVKVLVNRGNNRILRSCKSFFV